MRSSFLGLNVLAILLCSVSECRAAKAEVWYNTNYWTSSGNPNFDYTKDAQTGDPRAELVGNADNPGFYMAFDSDTNGALNPDGRLLFRVRVAAFQTQQNPPTNAPGEFGTTIFIGIDGNNDGAIDIFAVADDRGSVAQNGVSLYFPACPNGSQTCYTGPSNTNLGAKYLNQTTAFTVTGVAQNFNWARVSTTTDPRSGSEAVLDTDVSSPTDNNSYKVTDGFFSFAVDFRSVKNAMAASPSPVNGVSASTAMRFIAITAQQSNSLNQDIGGCNGGNVPSWNCGYSQTFTPNSLIPTPEPGTYVSTIVPLMGLVFLARRKRS